MPVTRSVIRVPHLLRRRGFSALLASELVSTTGTYITLLALPWFVLETTGSVTRTTLVMGAAALGHVVCGIPGGWVANNLGARRAMLLANLTRAPLVPLIPLLHEFGALQFWMLPVLAFLYEAQTAPYEGAQSAMIPDLVGEEPGVVAQATALFQAATRTTVFLGPALAGVLIGWIGAANALWVDAGSYLVAFLLTAAIPAVRAAPGVEQANRVLAGIRVLVSDPMLRLTTAAIALGEAAFAALIILFPILAFRRYDGDPHVAGALFAAIGVGALVGSVVAYRIVDRFPPARLGTLAFFGQVVPIWVLVADVHAGIAVTAMALSGFFAPIANAPTFSLVTLRVPTVVRPTVMTAFLTVIMAGTPVAVAITGPLVEAFGLAAVIAGVASLLTSAALVLIVRLPPLSRTPAPVRAFVVALDDAGEEAGEPT